MKSYIFLISCFLLASVTARADDPIIVKNSLITVRKSDVIAELARFPAEQHAEFLSSPSRTAKFVENIVVNKTLAAKARAKGLDGDELVKAEIANQADRVLARSQLEAEERSIALPDFRGRARELFVLDPAKYSSLPVYRLEQILFDTKCRSEAEGFALAARVKEDIQAGRISFAEAVLKYSSDVATKEKAGQLDPTTLDRLFPSIAEVIPPLKPGEVSPPVGTPFGIHLLRVVAMTPARLADFDTVAPGIVAALKTQYLKDRREAAVNAIRTDPDMKVDFGALESLIPGVPSPERTRRTH